MLVDFVADGGRLVILGGPFPLGQGGLRGTCRESVLPFTLAKGPGAEVVRCDGPCVLGPASGGSWPGGPAVLWRHVIEPARRCWPVPGARRSPPASPRARGLSVSSRARCSASRQPA